MVKWNNAALNSEYMVNTFGRVLQWQCIGRGCEDSLQIDNAAALGKNFKLFQKCACLSDISRVDVVEPSCSLLLLYNHQTKVCVAPLQTSKARRRAALQRSDLKY